jgi:hypothetical protein
MLKKTTLFFRQKQNKMTKKQNTNYTGIVFL